MPFHRPLVFLGALFLVLPSRAAAPEPLTEQDFRCHGVAGRRVRVDGREYVDCAGGHGPAGGVRSDLLDLLNRFQRAMESRVVVTSGYRCEAHNLYSWASVASTGDRDGVSRRSLHRAGAAADFTVEDAREASRYRDFEGRLKALAAERGLGVWTHVYGVHEVRDPDNRHDLPYLHVHLLGVERRSAPAAGTD